MMQISKEYLNKIVNRFNCVENIQEQWEFVQVELEKEQVSLVEQWLNDLLDGNVAKERIKSIQWLLNYIQRAIKQGETALVKIKELEDSA